MNSRIGFYGVRTNNLKDIDLEIDLNTITALTGASGGGKSSLAFDSVYALSKAEFGSISGDADDNNNYIVREHKNIIPTIAIRQKNTNINPHSTVFSYFKVQNLLLKDFRNNEDFSLLRLNKYENLCKTCSGSRLSLTIDEAKVVDPSVPIKDFPFRLFSAANKAKEQAKLIKYCQTLGISIDENLASVGKSAYNKLVFGVSEAKIDFRFRYSGVSRSKKEVYEGPMSRLKRYLHSSSKSEKSLAVAFCANLPCQECDGSGLDKTKYENVLVSGVSFFDLLTQEIDALSETIANKKVLKLFESISKLGIGHLSLSRSIPSLSGGELQKMRLAKASSTSMSGLLFVLDEVSANVPPTDYQNLIEVIKNIRSNGNTILLVDHVAPVIKIADTAYSIGPGAGSQGGEITKLSKGAITLPPLRKTTPYAFSERAFSSPLISHNNLDNLSLTFEEGSFCAVIGPSGSGKSSFFRKWSELSEEIIHVTQDVPRGNFRSTVATYLDLSEKFAKLFSNYSGEPESAFKYTQANSRLCPVCSGAGELVVGDAYLGQHRITCDGCDGNRIVGLDQFIVGGYNFYQASAMAVADLQEVPEFSRVGNVLEILGNLGLGHLSLGRRIDTLSGGEIKRLKLASYLQKRLKKKILVVDEPCAGLDLSSARKVLAYLSSISRTIKALVIVEHRQEALEFVDYFHILGPGSGRRGGKLVGTQVVLK